MSMIWGLPMIGSSIQSSRWRLPTSLVLAGIVTHCNAFSRLIGWTKGKHKRYKGKLLQTWQGKSARFGCTDVVPYKGTYVVLCISTILKSVYNWSVDSIDGFNLLQLGTSSGTRLLCLQWNKPSNRECFAAFSNQVTKQRTLLYPLSSLALNCL